MAHYDEKTTLLLIQNLTHQAINPLNGVIGTIDNIIDGTIDIEERRQQRLRSARAQLEYTVSLIRNLAYFALFDDSEGMSAVSGRKKICVIPQLLIEGAQFFQEQGYNHLIRIEVEDRQNQVAINGDPDLLRQVFMNLFDNFVKYGERGSIVSVKFWIQKKSQDVIVNIDGVSTPWDDSEDIFKIGFRGKAAQERTSAGSGLGLYICRLIVEKAFGGGISAQYMRERRTAHFEIRLPNAFQK